MLPQILQQPKLLNVVTPLIYTPLGYLQSRGAGLAHLAGGFLIGPQCPTLPPTPICKNRISYLKKQTGKVVSSLIGTNEPSARRMG